MTPSAHTDAPAEPAKPPPSKKKPTILARAKLYDNMVTASYTLHNGDLDREKLAQRAFSFEHREQTKLK